MPRRVLRLILMLAAVLAPQHTPAWPQDRSTSEAVDWVRALYEREVQHHAEPSAERMRIPDVFAPEIEALREAARRGPGARLEGAIVHPFFGRGVRPPQRVRLIAAVPGPRASDRQSVRVDLLIDDRPQQVTVIVTRACGDASARPFCIADIGYGSGNDYRAHLKEQAGH